MVVVVVVGRKAGENLGGPDVLRMAWILAVLISARPQDLMISSIFAAVAGASRMSSHAG